MGFGDHFVGSFPIRVVLSHFRRQYIFELILLVAETIIRELDFALIVEHHSFRLRFFLYLQFVVFMVFVTVAILYAEPFPLIFFFIFDIFIPIAFDLRLTGSIVCRPFFKFLRLPPNLLFALSFFSFLVTFAVFAVIVIDSVLLLTVK